MSIKGEIAAATSSHESMQAEEKGKKAQDRTVSARQPTLGLGEGGGASSFIPEHFQYPSKPSSIDAASLSIRRNLLQRLQHVSQEILKADTSTPPNQYTRAAQSTSTLRTSIFNLFYYGSDRLLAKRESDTSAPTLKRKYGNCGRNKGEIKFLYLDLVHNSGRCVHLFLVAACCLALRRRDAVLFAGGVPSSSSVTPRLFPASSNFFVSDTLGTRRASTRARY